MAESLNGKVAVITGVGSGFAKATAELFAELDQVGLVMIDINAQALKATADACEAAGSKVVAFAADVTKAETWQRALKETLDTFGKIDFLINYAGGALKVAPIEEMDDEINRRIIDLNLTSTIMSCRTFTPQFKKQGFGKIINVSSAAIGARGRVGRFTPPRRPASTPSRNAFTPSCGPTASPSLCWCRADPTPASRPPLQASMCSSGTKIWLCAPSISPTWFTKPVRFPRAAVSPRCLCTGWRRTSAGSNPGIASA